MAKNNIKSKKGFTIIEVVLVLAIAGLIFLMVFVALPALQRSQRDTQRRNDMSRVDTSLVQYQTNHSNQNPNLPKAGSWDPNDETNGMQKDSNGGDNYVYPTGCSSDSACSFIRDYMNTGSSENDSKANNFEDPEGVWYSMVITENWSNSANVKAVDSPDGKAELAVVDGTKYTIKNKGDENSFDAHTIFVVPGGRCDGDTVTSTTKNHFAILYRLEGAGVYCIDDQ